MPQQAINTAIDALFNRHDWRRLRKFLVFQYNCDVLLSLHCTIFLAVCGAVCLRQELPLIETYMKITKCQTVTDGNDVSDDLC